jgi:hypothetical protein
MANSQDFFTSLSILDDAYAEIRQQAIEYRTPACAARFVTASNLSLANNASMPWWSTMSSCSKVNFSRVSPRVYGIPSTRCAATT